MPAPEDREDARLLVAALREAGAIARRYFGGEYKVWQKSRGNPVTEADIAIDDFLKSHLLAARPHYGWMSEETADNPARLRAQRIFVVDPIDGTHGFIKHRPHFTLVAAVVEQGRPCAGAIYNPITDEMYEAAEGSGAFKNGSAIRTSTRRDFEAARFLAEHAVMNPARWDIPWPASLTSESRASAAYRMALVAEGGFDAMISLTPKSDWDVAAGDLIVREAGGVVTTREGESLTYNRETVLHMSIVCAGRAMHARLMTRLAELGPS